MRTVGEGERKSMLSGAVMAVTAILLFLTSCAAPVSAQRAAVHKCPVDGTAILERRTPTNAGMSWTLIFSADTRTRLEAADITGNDGLKHHNLFALDCLVDTIVQALHLCPGRWRHDYDNDVVGTVLEDGRLVVSGYCTSD